MVSAVPLEISLELGSMGMSMCDASFGTSRLSAQEGTTRLEATAARPLPDMFLVAGLCLSALL